ncbi:hypothetical protein DJ568_09725 [Mucilaginibacter hurinus]|uniref:Uncharacterized protein n=1 Tax=Mucilaginibacter hurinus TaxID=2201324 RepID=A0A367GMQ6_9SPHI|nr:hypothetical protein [Mucilaginibacter hurinus]RCH54757.1 hypothetical protein DJ568_09725 [Mucilaginibacter hurinus]
MKSTCKYWGIFLLSIFLGCKNEKQVSICINEVITSCILDENGEDSMGIGMTINNTSNQEIVFNGADYSDGRGYDFYIISKDLYSGISKLNIGSGYRDNISGFEKKKVGVTISIERLRKMLNKEVDSRVSDKNIFDFINAKQYSIILLSQNHKIAIFSTGEDFKISCIGNN